MSKKNITSINKVEPNKVHVTFDTGSGPMKYEYIGSSARAVLRGSDPANLLGRRIDKKK
jgi:hypothetical protein